MKIRRAVFSLFSCCFALQAATVYAAGIDAQLLEDVRDGQLATVQQLITDGADVNAFANNESPVHIATQKSCALCLQARCRR